MQLETQSFLRLVEAAKTIVSFDIEATGLRGDYNSILCVSIRPVGGEATTFAIETPGRDKSVVRDAAEMLSNADCWISYYGKGFDFPMINTRLLKWGLLPLQRKPHIDMYYSLKSNLLTARRSQAHLLDWLRIEKTGASTIAGDGEEVHKMSVSADEWNEVLAEPKKAMKTMIKRCESDTLGLQALYLRCKHLIKEVKA
jgi:uncharacterized protein YprB with RNaseH-like and TPR domain